MRKFLLLLLLSTFIYSVHTHFAKHGIYGDGNGYYAYAHALYFERKLDFAPIYGHLSDFQGRDYRFSRVFWNTEANPYGIMRNQWTIGTGLFWIPGLFSVDVINYMFGLNLSKFNLIYEIGAGMTGILLMITGLYFLERFLSMYFNRKIAQAVILIIFFATNILYYTAFEPALSHQPSFFLICLSLYLSKRLTVSQTGFFMFGILTGMLAITRIADVLLIIPSLLLYIHRKIQPVIRYKNILFLLIGIFTAILPQLMAQQYMYGSVFHNPYISGEQGFFRIHLFSILPLLFSVRNGFFLWAPVLLVAYVGLLLKHNDVITDIIRKLCFLSVSLFFIYMSLWNGAVTSGFGNRVLIGTIPYLSFGIASIFSRLSAKKIYMVFTAFSLWNILLLGQFYTDKPRMVEWKGLTLSNFFTGQFTTPYRLIKHLSIEEVYSLNMMGINVYKVRPSILYR